MFYERYIKRIFDLAGSMVALAVFAIPMLIVAILVKIDMPRGTTALFCQKRLTKNDREFELYKFRTMSPDAPIQRNVDNAEQYMSKLGLRLRKYSIDELPQLINIFLGHMSFVGPRPVPSVEEITVNGRRENGANKLRGGLTGWAQVSDRDATERERANYDGEYVNNVSIRHDIYIIYLTAKECIVGSGIRKYSKGIGQSDDSESASTAVLDR